MVHRAVRILLCHESHYVGAIFVMKILEMNAMNTLCMHIIIYHRHNNIKYHIIYTFVIRKTTILIICAFIIFFFLCIIRRRLISFRLDASSSIICTCCRRPARRRIAWSAVHTPTDFLLLLLFVYFNRRQ